MALLFMAIGELALTKGGHLRPSATASLTAFAGATHMGCLAALTF